MIDFTQFPSPCYIMEEELLRKNLSLIKQVADKAGVEIILAFKSFASGVHFPYSVSISHTLRQVPFTKPVWRSKSLAAKHIRIRLLTPNRTFRKLCVAAVISHLIHWRSFNGSIQWFWQKGVGSPAVFVLIPNIPKWKQNFIILVLPVPVLALQPICCPKFFRRVLRVFIAIVIASRRLLNWSILYSTLKRNSPIGFHR